MALVDDELWRTYGCLDGYEYLFNSYILLKNYFEVKCLWKYIWSPKSHKILMQFCLSINKQNYKKMINFCLSTHKQNYKNWYTFVCLPTNRIIKIDTLLFVYPQTKYKSWNIFVCSQNYKKSPPLCLLAYNWKLFSSHKQNHQIFEQIFLSTHKQRLIEIIHQAKNVSCLTDFAHLVQQQEKLFVSFNL